MQIYMKRGIEGKLKSSADDIGDNFDAGHSYVTKTTQTSGNTYQGVGWDPRSDTSATSGMTMVYSDQNQIDSGRENIEAWVR